MSAIVNNPTISVASMARVQQVPAWCLSLLGACLLWLSQPPLGLSLLAWVAVVPWIAFAVRTNLTRRDRFVFFLIAMGYWGLTMQGIRHAHPAMYAALIAFAFYLASYSLVFINLLSWLQRSKSRIPLWIAIPIIGTGLECIRNYLLTGVSAVMLGHTQANHETMIQIADAFGSYGITFLVLAMNAAIYHMIGIEHLPIAPRITRMRKRFVPLALAGCLLLGNLVYGAWRLSQANLVVETQRSHLNIALLGRDEEIVFVQDAKRESEIFQAYFLQSVEAAKSVAESGQRLDAVVWPESMYTGSLPWMLIDPPTSPDSRIDPEFAAVIKENQDAFQSRGAFVQAAIRNITGQANDPDLIVGCSVVRYNDPPKVHSGIVHLAEQGKVKSWYGKTHLVMFGEYIPLIDYLPFLNRFIPPGMGVARGDGPKSMVVGEVGLVPNICIETAVERVAPQHVAELTREQFSADAIVNVTNDGWFDRSSVVEHHLRCSQFVAVATRRPVLISANGGPTAWIDGSGRVIERLAYEQSGAIIVNLSVDNRWGLYQAIQDWPARMLAGYCFVLMLQACIKYYRERRKSKALSDI